MNKLIQKIAIDTDVYCDQNYFNDPFYVVKWEQAFAELIIQRCKDAVEKTDPTTAQRAIEAINREFETK